MGLEERVGGGEGGRAVGRLSCGVEGREEGSEG